MGRSVMTHSHAVETVYLHPEFEDQDAEFAWPDFVEDLTDNVLMPRFPAFTKCDRWEGRENHVVLENCQVEVSVSEYCGLVAVCLAPLDPDNAFLVAVAERMASGFRGCLYTAFSQSALVKVGTFSNGESVYQKI